MIAPGAGGDDVVVAQVGGRPVWGSCVATQAKRGGRTREVALAECIDFELLAQAAEAHGLAAHAEVVAATRVSIVSRLVERDFEQKYRGPEDLKPQLDQVLESARDAMNRPELRGSAHALVRVPDKAAPEVDRDARVLAERIHAALATEPGLHASHLEETARRLARETKLELVFESHAVMPREARFAPEYLTALFSIPEVGRVSAVTRTSYGWHVILLTEVVARKQFTRDEFADLVFPDVRRKHFKEWSDAIADSLGLAIKKDYSQLAPLDAEDR